MNTWLSVWIIVLGAGLALFAGLVVVITIGGYRDIRAMFRRIDEQHAGRKTEESRHL